MSEITEQEAGPQLVSPPTKEEVTDWVAKNRQIRKTRMETIARHRKMVCKTYELKVDRSHLSNETLESLRMLLLESKWFYNDMLERNIRGEQDVWVPTTNERKSSSGIRTKYSRLGN